MLAADPREKGKSGDASHALCPETSLVLRAAAGTLVRLSASAGMAAPRGCLAPRSSLPATGRQGTGLLDRRAAGRGNPRVGRQRGLRSGRGLWTALWCGLLDRAVGALHT